MAIHVTGTCATTQAHKTMSDERTVSAPLERGSDRARMFAFVAVGAASICAASWYASDQLSWEDYATHVGQETAALPDGTTVTLNTDTDLRVRLTLRGRE